MLERYRQDTDFESCGVIPTAAHEEEQPSESFANASEGSATGSMLRIDMVVARMLTGSGFGSELPRIRGPARHARSLIAPSGPPETSTASIDRSDASEHRQNALAYS